LVEPRRAKALIAPLLALFFSLALLAPTADRGALVALAVGHLLGDDLAQAFPDSGPAADPSTSLFRSLDLLLVDAREPTVAASVQLDGVSAWNPAFARAVSAQLNRYSESRRAGQPRVRLVTGDAAQLRLALDLRSVDGRVSMAARLTDGDRVLEVERTPGRALPGRGALLPPLLAIAIALALRRTLLALFVGIYSGAVILLLERGSSIAGALVLGFWDVFAVYFRAQLFDTFRAEIIGFIVALIAMIGVITRAGGVQGLVERGAALVRSVRSALFVTWGMGLLIFFDDYANCMLVGTTMRPLTDRLRISREKLAYIVDSTAAPIAGISLLSTWIAFEVSVFSAQLPEVGISESGYAFFLRALPFRYYCILTLVFVAATIASGRDFGPMARAERRARREGLLVAPGSRPAVSERLSTMQPAPQMRRDWRLAVGPIALTLLMTTARIFVDGGGVALFRQSPSALWTLEGIGGVILTGGGATPIFFGACSGLLLAVYLAGSRALRAGAALGVLAASVLEFVGNPVAAALGPAVGESLAGFLGFVFVFAAISCSAGFMVSHWGRATERPHLGLSEIRNAGFGGASALGFAVVLLFQAWMIGAICRDLATADYLVALLSGWLPPVLLPLLLFAVASAVSFATGSSWSTMSILLPNVVALAASLGDQTQLGVVGMVAISIGAVLDGAIFGDHCSPISDTTVLSSVASGCDHLDHVRTQAPYAFVTAAVAVTCGYLPSVLLGWWSFPLALACGALLVAALLAGLGRRLPDASPG
jgi:Na+/H+ antiporter NhaC